MQALGLAQVTSTWRKVAPKFEGEEAFEDLEKIDRLEVFQQYIRCASRPALRTASMPALHACHARVPAAPAKAIFALRWLGVARLHGRLPCNASPAQILCSLCI